MARGSAVFRIRTYYSGKDGLPYKSHRRMVTGKPAVIENGVDGIGGRTIGKRPVKHDASRHHYLLRRFIGAPTIFPAFKKNHCAVHARDTASTIMLFNS
jgi:hypothetical protein